MSPREDFIQEEGVVSESLANALFRVEVAGQAEPILCHLSGKMRKFFIKVLPGDRVIFDMSPYDLTKGRITRRLKPGEPGLREQAEIAAASAAALESASTDDQPDESSGLSPEITEEQSAASED